MRLRGQLFAGKSVFTKFGLKIELDYQADIYDVTIMSRKYYGCDIQSCFILSSHSIEEIQKVNVHL